MRLSQILRKLGEELLYMIDIGYALFSYIGFAMIFVREYYFQVSTEDTNN